jgi:hypothetical protein
MVGSVEVKGMAGGDIWKRLIAGRGEGEGEGEGEEKEGREGKEDAD